MITKFNLFESVNLIEPIIENKNEFKTLFQVKGVTYFFQARNEELIQPDFIRYGWHIGFGVDGIKDKYIKTGFGYPFKILPLVLESFRLFINKYNPEKMSFISEGDTKTGIYNNFINKIGDFDMTKEDSKLDSFSGEIPWLIKYTKIINI